MDKGERLKAHPFIIDEALASRPDWLYNDRKRYEEIVAASKRSERFLFSNAASGLLGRFITECGDLVLQHRQFAIPPYGEMYFEVQKPFFTTFSSIAYGPNGQMRVLDTPPTDASLGYLITGNYVHVFAAGTGGTPKLSPVYYTWAPPGEVARYDRPERGRPIIMTGEHARWSTLGLILGNAIHKIKDEETKESLLTEVHPHVFPPWAKLVKENDGTGGLNTALNTLLQGTAGDMRNIWAALLWLNRPVHTTISNQPAGRRFFKGKQIAYKAHHAVEIDLHKHRSIRRAFVLSGERLSPRRHRVRGAFHHTGGTFACSHVWPLTPDVDGHWKCHRCGRLRWWQKDHMRGDSTRGYVDHTYGVTTGEEIKT